MPTSYFDTLVEALGLLLYTPLVEDETKRMPTAVPLKTLPSGSRLPMLQGRPSRDSPEHVSVNYSKMGVQLTCDEKSSRDSVDSIHG